MWGWRGERDEHQQRVKKMCEETYGGFSGYEKEIESAKMLGDGILEQKQEILWIGVIWLRFTGACTVPLCRLFCFATPLSLPPTLSLLFIWTAHHGIIIIPQPYKTHIGTTNFGQIHTLSARFFFRPSKQHRISPVPRVQRERERKDR